ncbi:ABC transporter ATP-binding protein [Thermoanaerobacterium sp. CMT5567-10]|uniref:ABC transporter ATP-binding protein n=1 Tax=Thermoanaerobacterium sp. CMT5567-10 TaxID=3061989 RepID=UPI00287F78D2|nr:ABC transporter ATP-binding protein [Thermoanaerobacterium sp. CMT5567-10]WKV08522.2 ABC transporter ATP-binding protein [Thermoanaerobacterium sp. CMT5567-10]
MYAIEVNDVTKIYKIHRGKPTTLKDRLILRNRNLVDEFIPLNNVSLKVEKGESIGIIGENGSGKSTLLKLISKIIYPDKGEIITKGKVSSLIELGAGFHPDFTGRENIYVNASIFGFTKKEIDKKIDDIISFSELEEFIDTPVRTYSSGMYMRLAFSVAINIDPDILLIDEILAVGDEHFQKKCFNKLSEFKKKGITIVIVSHDIGAIERLCDKAVWIDKGIVKEEGTPRDVIRSYLDFLAERDNKKALNDKEKSSKADIKQEHAIGTGEIRITDVKLLDATGEEKNTFVTGDEAIIKISYKRNSDVGNDVVFGMAVYNNNGLNCFGTNTHLDNINIEELKSEGEVLFRIKELNLLDGEYFLDISCHRINGELYDYKKSVLTFNMYSLIKEVGIFRLDHEWQIL